MGNIEQLNISELEITKWSWNDDSYEIQIACLLFLRQNLNH